MAENTKPAQAVLILEDNTTKATIVSAMLTRGLGIVDKTERLYGDLEEDDFLVAQRVIEDCRGKIAMVLDNKTSNGGAVVFLRKVADAIRNQLLEIVDRTFVIFPNTSDSATDLAELKVKLERICEEYPDTLKMGDDLGNPMTIQTVCAAFLNAGFNVPKNVFDQKEEEPENDEGPPTYTADMTAEAALEKIERALPELIDFLERVRAADIGRTAKRTELKWVANEIINLWDSASSKLPQKGTGRLIKIMFHTVTGYAREIRELVESVHKAGDLNNIATNLIGILEATKFKEPNTEATLSSPMPAFEGLHTYYARNKRVHFISMPTELPVTAIDPWHIQIAVMNLITNAQQIARADSVEVSITQEGANIKVTVSDNGRPFRADWTPEEALQGEGGRTGNGLRDIEFLGMNLDFAEYRGKAGMRAFLQRLWLQWKGAPYPKAISILVPTEAQTSLVKA